VAAYAVDNPYLNIGQIVRSGWDFEASYRLGLGELLGSGPSAITLRFSGTLLDEYGENLNNTGFISRKGETSAVGSPEFITNSSATYDDDQLTMQLQMRTLSSGNYNNLFTEGVQISDNSVEGAAYLNFSTTIRATEQAEFFAVVNNLLDRDPELIPQNFGYPTVPQYFDTIGRSYRVGVRIKLP
jgi:outer membrane receptor protein involved in Fe transport